MIGNAFQGVRVIESSAFIAAPLCGLTLAQYGADVIRIDPVGGGLDYRRMPRVSGGRSVYWTSLNKGKRSIAVDFRSPEGRELVQALVTAEGPGNGILLTNIATPFLAHDALVQRRPDLISCVIEGNFDGSTAVDYTVNCATGYPMITGTGSADHPVNHAFPAWDVACAYHAAFGLASAVMQRALSGNGAALRMALSDVAFATLSHLGVLTEASLGLPEREAIGNDIYGAFGRDFRTADGRRLMVAAISARQWRSLVTACGIETEIGQIEQAFEIDLGDEAHRFEARDRIAAVIAPWVGSRNFADIARLFDDAGVCWGPYRSVRELLEQDVRLSDRNALFSRIDTPGIGRHVAAGATIRQAGQPATAPAPAPVLGEHTDQILAEVLGLPDTAIGSLHDRKIVAGASADPLM